MPKKTTEQISYNMSRVKNRDSKIELLLRRELWKRGLRYRKNVRKIYGCPDVVFENKKVAVFVDSEFWHGYDWDNKRNEIKSNQDFWVSKIEKNISRDRAVNIKLRRDGWRVIRFWGHEIESNPSLCAEIIEKSVTGNEKALKYKTIDLCAGIGGMRKGFELTDLFENISAAEIDKYACATYEHLYHQDARNDVTDEEYETFKGKDKRPFR